MALPGYLDPSFPVPASNKLCVRAAHDSSFALQADKIFHYPVQARMRLQPSPSRLPFVLPPRGPLLFLVPPRIARLLCLHRILSGAHDASLFSSVSHRAPQIRRRPSSPSSLLFTVLAHAQGAPVTRQEGRRGLVMALSPSRSPVHLLSSISCTPRAAALLSLSLSRPSVLPHVSPTISSPRLPFRTQPVALLDSSPGLLSVFARRLSFAFRFFTLFDVSVSRVSFARCELSQTRKFDIDCRPPSPPSCSQRCSLTVRRHERHAA